MSEQELRDRIRLLEQLLDELEAVELASKNIFAAYKGDPADAEEDTTAPPRRNYH